MDVDGVTFRDYQDEDQEWVLLAMVASTRATIRPERNAEIDDLALLDVARASFDRYHARAKGPDKLIIAWQGERRIGLVWITMEKLNQDPGNAWLLEVFVEPVYRRQGLARMLLGLAEQWARKQGAGCIWLNVGGGNDKAIALYRSIGYDLETMHMSKRLTDRS